MLERASHAGRHADPPGRPCQTRRMPEHYAPDDHATDRALLVAASYVLLRRDDQVLLQLRRGTGYMDEHWATMAGHVEPGESVHEAAARELSEEAGVRVRVEDLVPVTMLHRYEVGGAQVEQRCDVFFEARAWTGEPRIMEPAKCAAMEWFQLDALPSPVVPHELLVLEGLRPGASLPAVVSYRTGG